MKSTCPFCQPTRSHSSGIAAAHNASAPRRRRGWLRRVGRGFSWIGSAAVLALVPKCPACLAAYISLGTGIGVSLSIAENLRVALIAVAVASLSWLSFQLIRGRVRQNARATAG